MGYGDEIIGSGLARGAAARGRRIAFGDGSRIFWSRQAAEIYLNNPNVAPPGSEHRARDLEWIPYYKGRRFYGHQVGEKRDRWKFVDWTCPTGEIYFSDQERVAFRKKWPDGLPERPVVIEPTVKAHGACNGHNKQWPIERYREVAHQITKAGHWVVRLGTNPMDAPELDLVHTATFREALIFLAMARLYIGPEGGLHHAAAALGIPAVVIFGGFNTPRSTGYSWHENLTAGGDASPCGMIEPCPHCARAMKAISVSDVLAASNRLFTRCHPPNPYARTS